MLVYTITSITIIIMLLLICYYYVPSCSDHFCYCCVTHFSYAVSGLYIVSEVNNLPWVPLSMITEFP